MGWGGVWVGVCIAVHDDGCRLETGMNVWGGFVLSWCCVVCCGTVARRRQVGSAGGTGAAASGVLRWRVMQITTDIKHRICS
jgi:hypothetical protein